jgi:MoxR-like ATPase
MRETPRPELAKLQQGVEKVIKGKTAQIQFALTALLAEGHLLIEDVPGVGKTTLAHMIAKLIDCEFRRVQFTSDLLPSDILGVTIYNRDSNEFEFKRGPIFSSILLADEINRATPKTQSGLLEAMAHRQVTVDGVSHPLPRPFFVIATQNPAESHGTFPLPKSQVDRFMMRLTMGYPDLSEEMAVLREQARHVDFDQFEPLLHGEDIAAMQRQTAEMRVDDSLLEYIGRLVAATRESPEVELGISTRGALALRRAAQARAFYFGRDFVVPDDVKLVAPRVLAHRLQLAGGFEFAGSAPAGRRRRDDEAFIERLLDEIAVPV